MCESPYRLELDIDEVARTVSTPARPSPLLPYLTQIITEPFVLLRLLFTSRPIVARWNVG